MLSTLIRLDISYNLISNLSKLQALTQLEELDVSHNQIRDLA